jgi:hypothetical protein
MRQAASSDLGFFDAPGEGFATGGMAGKSGTVPKAAKCIKVAKGGLYWNMYALIFRL